MSIDEAHVDHAPPNTEYVAGRFFDHNERAAFLVYHTANASLRILTARTNLSLPRKRRC